MQRIDFYGHTKEYGFLSNFYPSRIYIGGMWETVEHYFQGMKVIGPLERRAIRCAESPAEAKKLGRKFEMRDDWEAVKDSFMLLGLEAKFGQNTDLREKLFQTAPCYLSEHTKNDNYWGDGGDDTGKSMLGRLLMIVRFNLQEEFKGTKG